MSQIESAILAVDEIATLAKANGIAHLHTRQVALQSNMLDIGDQHLVNFGSCSYLGLEFEGRLKEAAKQAIDDFGTQFSASRAYVSCGLYERLEEHFCEIFGNPSIVAPTTTLGHIAAIPVLVKDTDAVILDHQVHSSVQNAVALLKPRGIKVEMIRHNRMDLLEERIRELSARHQSIWYMADGIYSMYGDGAPIPEIQRLLDTYENFHFYVDDAHGMSCYGEKGQGFVLSNMKLHSRMVLAVSLAKAFATGGAVLVFPDEKKAQQVRNCGGPLITSGPMQPAALGAAVASAALHLDGSIQPLQEKLHRNIALTNHLLHEYGLPLVMQNQSPVFFCGVGLPKVGYNLIRRLMNEGFYTNIGIFPAVPLKNTGVRFTITSLHTSNQIKGLMETMAYHLPQVLEEESYTMEALCKSFKMPLVFPKENSSAILQQASVATQLELHTSKSIKSIHKEWKEIVSPDSLVSAANLETFEKGFTGNPRKEENWEFDYLLVKDGAGQTVAATVLTTCWIKDDMMSDEKTSVIMESIRESRDPYYMTSRCMYMGTIGTEGEHLFVDQNHVQWKEALNMILNKTQELGEKYEVSALVIRDFDGEDKLLHNHLLDNGYISQALPESNEMTLQPGLTPETYFASLSRSQKKHFRYYVGKHTDKYEVKITNRLSDTELERAYALYLNVQKRSLEMNTFAFPFKLFKEINDSGNWEFILLNLKDEFNYERSEQPVAFMLNSVQGNTYHFALVGIDYTYLETFMPYKQAIYQVILQAAQHGCNQVQMGFTTSQVKRKFGAGQKKRMAYVQTKDHYAHEALDTMSGQYE